jgi:membrane protease YdiL (CAAX protease family)
VTRVRAVALAGAILFWVVLGVAASMTDLALVDAILLAVLLVAVPAMSVAQLPLIEGVKIERLPAYLSSITTLWLIGTACWFVGTREDGAAALGLVGLPLPAFIGWTLGLTVAALAIIVVFRAAAGWLGVPDSPVLRQLLPVTPRERAAFALLSVAAGTGEELAYRGYVIPVLTPVLGIGPAAVLSTAVFGIMHGYQGTMGIIRTGLMGAVLVWGFLASGSLWPPILAHTFIDLLVGLVFGDRLLIDPAD